MTDYEHSTDDGFWHFWWPRALRESQGVGNDSGSAS